MSTTPFDTFPTPPHCSESLAGWQSQEKRISAVEAALRNLGQSGGEPGEALSRLVRELIEDFRGRQEVESAAMKRVGAVALQCARVLDGMERRLWATATREEFAAMGEAMAAELGRLRAAAHEHLATALRRETEKASEGFPVVYLN